ncbi:DUF883 family protein [Oricola cellulosilytica]|uniref:DUF883 family protein n=1 Tax=Oricola cellulosilytica TaxID=1429082 RepID=A0A4R0PHP4_9HYPH|nr:DUF883 family protein [Oricola cellulosilytica]TCD15094.1 DUF883 family protein [Oricola cellulosilytica]
MTTKSTAGSSDVSNANTSAREKELSREIEGLREDLAALTKRFSKISDAGVRAASEYSRDAKAVAMERGEALYSDLTSRATDLERDAVRSIRQHPLQAVGLAVGIGFLAALLTRR